MFFVRRSGEVDRTYVNVRVGLFFFAAGLWLAGVKVQNTTLTAMALGIALFAVCLGLLGRRRRRSEVDDA